MYILWLLTGMGFPERSWNLLPRRSLEALWIRTWRPAVDSPVWVSRLDLQWFLPTLTILLFSETFWEKKLDLSFLRSIWYTEARQTRRQGRKKVKKAISFLLCLQNNDSFKVATQHPSNSKMWTWISWNIMTEISLILFSWAEDFVFCQSRSFTIQLAVLVSYSNWSLPMWPRKYLTSQDAEFFTSYWNWSWIQQWCEH